MNTVASSVSRTIRTFEVEVGSVRPRYRVYDSVKRLGDVIGALFLLILNVPVLLVAICAVKLTSPGAAIFSQKRLGLGGRVFTIYKLRSMRQDAEKSGAAQWASKNDDRVTPVGRFLRQTRIDELPQLYNVLLGDMSLIGPRPERPEFSDELESVIPGYRKRLMVKPGITGLAQVSSGYAACHRSYKRKVAMDLIYIRHRSFWLDLRIAIRTVIVVITGSGAR